MQTRDVLSKLDGVIRVHPNGLNGKALLFVKGKKSVTEEQVEKALAGTPKLRLRKFQKTKA